MTAGAALAQDSTGSGSSDKQGSSAAAPGAMAAQLTTASAKIDKVDLDKRELTLQTDDHKPFTIQVPEDVKGLEHAKAGDKIRVSFYESVAVSLNKPGEAQPGIEKKTTVDRAPGKLPGGAVVQQITTTATISKVAAGKDELTIEGPGGKKNTIKVDDPDVRSQLSRLKVGDQIQTTYTQAMATRLTPARAM